VQAESSNDAGKVRVLQRDNAALHVRVKGLLSEIEELWSEKEKLSLDADSVQRTLEKQLSDLQATLRSLEVSCVFINVMDYHAICVIRLYKYNRQSLVHSKDAYL
jgi:phosphatidylserine decarboxylase